MHECDSVLNYINVLNNGSALKEYRTVERRRYTLTHFLLTETLDALRSSDKDLFSKVKSNITAKLEKTII